MLIAAAHHFPIVNLLVALLVAAIVYWFATYIGLPQIVAALVAIVIVLIGIGVGY